MSAPTRTEQWKRKGERGSSLAAKKEAVRARWGRRGYAGDVLSRSMLVPRFLRTGETSELENNHLPRPEEWPHPEERTSLRLLLPGDEITVPRDAPGNWLWAQHS